MKKEYMLPLSRLALKNEEVCLIRTRRAEGDPLRNWVATDMFAICLPEKHPFFGYEVVGRCDLRFGYNRSLYYGGNIGYRVWEAYRGNHMARKAAALLLEYAARRSMPYVIITCNPDNWPSRRSIEALLEPYGGELLETVDLPPDNDMYKAGERQKCVYHFPLTPEAAHKVLANGNYEAYPDLTEFRPTVLEGKILIHAYEEMNR